MERYYFKDEMHNLLTSHCSERNFLEKDIDSEIIDKLTEAAYRAPTSVNSQQVSVIITKDRQKRKDLSLLAGGQPWIEKAPVFITVVMDYRKTITSAQMSGHEQIMHKSLEGVLAGFLDSGIALYAMLLAARIEGLGAVPIGGIRLNPMKVTKLLSLPEYVYPVAGLAIGYTDSQPALKPRLAKRTFQHSESYCDSFLKEDIISYDTELMKYWASTGRNDGMNWTNSVSSHYTRNDYEHIHDTLNRNGFL